MNDSIFDKKDTRKAVTEQLEYLYEENLAKIRNYALTLMARQELDSLLDAYPLEFFDILRIKAFILDMITIRFSEAMRDSENEDISPTARYRYADMSYLDLHIPLYEKMRAGEDVNPQGKPTEDDK